MQPFTRASRIAGFQPACRQDAGGPVDIGFICTASVVPASTSATCGASVLWRSRGYLPHIDAPSLVQHVIFRLADSLPPKLRGDLEKQTSGDRVLAVDEALDAGHGMRHLANPSIAELVQTALLAFDDARYALLAWCVMPNHVHALLRTKSGHGLQQIVHSWKSYTANAANRILRRSGSFWAREYFDRFMRDEEHLAKTAAYIEANPVNAGLCQELANWPFSSGSARWIGSVRIAGFQPACREDAGGPAS